MEYDEEVDAGEEGGIVRAKSAYMYFQTMNASAIKEELIKEGADTGFGAMGSAISARWKALSDSDKEIYLSLAREDKERYNAECAQRDEEVLRLQGTHSLTHLTTYSLTHLTTYSLTHSLKNNVVVKIMPLSKILECVKRHYKVLKL